MSQHVSMCRRGVFFTLAAAYLASFGGSASADIITGVTATASSEIGDPFVRPAQAAVDGSGLEEGGDNSAVTADQRSLSGEVDGNNNWLSTGAGFGGVDPDPSFLVDLGAEFEVAGVRIFNYAEHTGGGDLTNRGVRSVDISISSDNTTFTPIASDFELPQAIVPVPDDFNDFGTYFTAADLTGETVDSVSFRYLRFDINSNWGDVADTFYGLSELQFEAVPEPTSMILALGGVLVLAWRPRRK